MRIAAAAIGRSHAPAAPASTPADAAKMAGGSMREQRLHDDPALLADAPDDEIHAEIRRQIRAKYSADWIQ